MSQKIEKHNKIEIFGNIRRSLISVEDLAEFISEGGGGDVTVNIDDVVGVTSVGLSVAKATTQANARTAIGAGTSNLTLGTTPTTAKAGNYVPTWGEVTGKPTTFAPVIGDTATTALAGNTPLLQIGNTATTAKAGNYTPPVATASVSGTVKLSTDTVQTVAPTAATSTAGRTYMVQNLASGSMVVNVPWVNTTYTLPVATTSALGGVKAVDAPVIDITEPADAEQIQSQLQAIIDAIKASGVFL